MNKSLFPNKIIIHNEIQNSLSELQILKHWFDMFNSSERASWTTTENLEVGQLEFTYQVNSLEWTESKELIYVSKLKIPSQGLCKKSNSILYCPRPVPSTITQALNYVRYDSP